MPLVHSFRLDGTFWINSFTAVKKIYKELPGLR